MGNRYLFSLDHGVARTKGGNKAKNLGFLIRHHVAVPAGWVLSWDAWTDYQRHGNEVLDSLRKELSTRLKAGQAYAVRSSASVEDDKDCSCAGLFLSFLGADRLATILDQILAVWQSSASDEYLAYRHSQKLPDQPVQMGVIIQEMVAATCSGVAFSKNPLTGLSETILEVGRGTGEDQVQSKQNPERWISKWGRWLHKPEQGLISESLADDLVRQTQSIARLYGKPVDLEWAYDGQNLYFLQVRPITQLDIPIFSNRIAKEMLPGIIKPLVWSVNTRLINAVWVDILVRLTGDRSFRPEELTGHYYNRAYFNMAVFGRVFERLGMPYEALELLFGLEQEGPDKPQMRPGLGILPLLPRLTVFTISLLGIERQLKRVIQDKQRRYQQLIDLAKSGLSSEDWLEWLHKVHEETGPVAYFNIMIPMLAMMHHRMLTQQLKRLGYDARLLELDGVAAAAAQFSPHQRLEQLRQKYGSIDLANDSEVARRLAQDIEQFIEAFGHFSDSGNDCSRVPWRETPDLIRQMVVQPIPARPLPAEKMTLEALKIPWFKRPMIRWSYQGASRFGVHREAISSLYTFGYGQFRAGFMALGHHLATSGLIEQSDDIFYLYWQELVDLVQQKTPASQKALIASRRQAIENARDAMLPELIFGLAEPPVHAACEPAWTGIPTSLGTYTGPAKVLCGIQDFSKLDPGDILVIPFSDVGWTPLFAKAGAVIAESGGILSHSSIIAREYRIPAVVSVSGACRIPDGTILTVNGNTGEILLDENCRSRVVPAF